MSASLLAAARRRLAQAFFRWRRPMTLGVRVIAFDEAGRVVLVRHTYVDGWHLPGGGVERGETCVEAAVKELREEAGLEAEAADLALVSVHANFASFPGDHVLVYRASRHRPLAPSERTSHALEIAACDAFALDALPADVTGATRRRLAEAAGAPVDPNW